MITDANVLALSMLLLLWTHSDNQFHLIDIDSRVSSAHTLHFVYHSKKGVSSAIEHIQ